MMFDFSYLLDLQTIKLDEALPNNWSQDATIENLVDMSIYIDSVLKVHENVVTKSILDRIRKMKVKDNQIPQKCQNFVNKHKRNTFDKVKASKRVFKSLIEILGDDKKVSKESIDVLEKLFSAVNAKLNVDE